MKPVPVISPNDTLELRETYKMQILAALRKAGHEAVAEADEMTQLLERLLDDVAYYTLRQDAAGVDWTLGRLKLLALEVHLKLQNEVEILIRSVVEAGAVIGMEIVRVLLSRLDKEIGP